MSDALLDRLPSTWSGTGPGSPAGRRTRWVGRLHRLLRGNRRDPAWVRPVLCGLLVGTAVLYLWDLGASGWANSFYTAAVQAGTRSWKAFFFGSFDSSNFITVDKPPAALWVMELSARAFGLNAWSVLVPQALEGVAAVGLLYATVRRRFGPAPGLLAGAMLALTPVAALMFRYNNPDALLVLLLVAAAYAFNRAIESTKTRWLLLCAALVGTGFITKMLQAFLVLPAFALTYLFLADTSWKRRLGQLVAAGAALVAAAGWWVAAVQLTPATARPYIGGSQNNSLLDLIFGYNGFGRLTGNESGSVVPGGTGQAGMWGPTGITRLFGTQFGGQISWLLPAALLLLVALLWLTRRARRTDQRRAQVLMWGGWLVVTGVVFSFAQGIIHPYYSVAMAPPIAALVAIGATVLWRRRKATPFARFSLAVALAGTSVWSWVLLDRTASWHPDLRLAVLVVGLVAAGVLLAAARTGRWLTVAVATAALSAGLGGPVAYALETAATPHSGAIPSAGPTVTGAFPGRVPAGRAPGGSLPGTGGFPGGPGGSLPGGGSGAGGLPGPGGSPAGPAAGGRLPGPSGAGGLLDSQRPSAAVVVLLRADATRYSWVAATVGADNAAGYQIAADEPVMAIGGFNGTDPAPTLAEFQAWVAHGRIHYFISGGAGATGSSGTAGQITRWVEEHYTPQTVDGVTLYELTPAASVG